MMYTSKALADILGVHTSTLMDWEAQGVIPEVERDSAGRRLYSQEEVDRIKQIGAKRREAWLKQQAGQ